MKTKSCVYAKMVLHALTGLGAILFCICLTGCSDEVTSSTVQQVSMFENAGPSGPRIDMESIVRARIATGPYRVSSGEVLELTMPTILQIVTAEESNVTEKNVPFVCRISESGTITLPAVGEISAEGKTLAEIEAAITDAYYPKYAKTRPTVFCRVLEYELVKVSISGAVEKPGIYSLRNDQMSLVALLMEAGGIVEDGAAVIQIIHSGENGGEIGARDVSEESAEVSIVKLSERDDTEVVTLYADQTILDDVKPVFIPEYGNWSTRGELIVQSGSKTLLAEKLDIASRAQREAFWKKLSGIAPSVSTGELEKTVLVLVEQLMPGANMSAADDRVEDGESLFADVVADIEKTDSNILERNVSERAAVLGANVGEGDENSEIEEPRTAKAEGAKTSVIMLPVKGLNIPFADVVLREGDVVLVERLQIPLFTVTGLVDKPGNFMYPPDVNYTLMQALGFAGGLDKDAKPRYVTVYRLNADGTIASGVFKVADATVAELTMAMNLPIKPGDIVDVAHTPRTRTNLFLQRVFNVNVGAYVPLTN